MEVLNWEVFVEKKKCWDHVGGSHLTLEALTTGAEGAPYDEPPYLAGGGA